MVERVGNSLRLERKVEPGNVQSEWDCENQVAPDYAGTMASMAREALKDRRGPQRILLLGLGGGTVAADLLCGGKTRLADWRLHVTAIESDADVAAAAHEHFSPEMFRGQPYELEQNRLSVIVADAVELVRDRPFRGEKFDVILEDFAYESPGLLQADFWRALRKRYAARDATLIINTLYPERSQMEEFELELQDAGWSDVQQLVDRGLQALPGEPKLSWDTADWEPLDNMIFLAKNQEQAVD